MTPEFFTFLMCAAVAVAGAVAMVLSRNAVYAAMYLILVFGAVAVIFLLLNAPFLAAVQVTVYTGAIMVLFLFVIMLLGAERLNPEEREPTLRWQRPAAIGLGAVLALQAVYVLFVRGAAAVAPPIDSSPLAVGRQLFTAYLFPFEVASILLLVAMVGAVVLTKKD